MPEEFPARYDQSKEPELYATWEQSGAFKPSGNGEPFSMVLPPPNVTGSLHVGHAVVVAIEDLMVRYHRMKGDNTLWIPGVDHAAIATQNVVEKKIRKEKDQTRHQLGREAFLKEVDAFVETTKDRILTQVRSLGASLDWDRLAYTLDDERSLAVRTIFKQMYDAGILYRGNRIVNWCPRCQSTLADDEVEYREETTPFYYFKYGPVVIGTARPETKFLDKTIVVHPNDPRYKALVGTTITVEWIDGAVEATVIADPIVDPKFGTGAMTITPAHSFEDFELAQKHGLPTPLIINEYGKLTEAAGEFAGQKARDARPAIVEKLKAKGLVEKIDETYTHNLSICYRCSTPIEPLPKLQWFVAVSKPFRGGKSLKDLMLAAVKSEENPTGEIEILPDHYTKVYHHWIHNLRDWCISRQIWFGHQLPVWYKTANQSTKITYFVHGTTTDNEEGRMSGAKDVALSTLGLQQNEELREQLKDQPFDVVITSDLQRAQKTAETVFGDRGIEIVVDKRLRERNDGIHNGALASEVRLDEFKHINEPVPDGESCADVARRMASLLSEIQDKYPGKRIALVGHRFPQLAIEVLTSAKSWQKALETDWRHTKAWQPGWTYDISKLLVADMQAPAGEGWEQDPDTLDTWFSSGTWTFSTLGWPNKPEELKTFHPTSVLETGYDILFFWVARMILMSEFALQEVPFKTVYLHGLVRDKDRQKMSKSKGNVVDPLGIVEEYGADALRMALLFGTGMGGDAVISEEKVRGMRNFGTKLWNIARFTVTNLGELSSQTGSPQAKQDLGSSSDDQKTWIPDQVRNDVQPITEADKHILAELANTTDIVSRSLEDMRFHLAAEKLYDFIWGTFAATYVEASKEQLKDEKLATNTRAILLHVLKQSVTLLHPFMPFVTEAIWQQLPKTAQDSNLLISQSWPS